MDLKDKSNTLASKMNLLTERFTENMDTADEMILVSSDIIDYVDEKTEDIQLYSKNNTSSTDIIPDIVNLNNLVQDFKYIRETLRENTDNGRRILNAVTLDLLDVDNDKRVDLISSFAELNRAIADNMKLYFIGYKEISNTLLNLNKINKSKLNKDGSLKRAKTVKKTLILNAEPISTADLIKELSINK